MAEDIERLRSRIAANLAGEPSQRSDKREVITIDIGHPVGGPPDPRCVWFMEQIAEKYPEFRRFIGHVSEGS